MQNSISFSLSLTTDFSVMPTFHPLKLTDPFLPLAIAGNAFIASQITWNLRRLLLSALISAGALSPATPTRVLSSALA